MKKIQFALIFITSIMILFSCTEKAFAQTPTLRFDPTPKLVDMGETFNVNLVVDNVTNLGAFEFELTYNSGVIHADAATMGAFLGSTGRTVIPAGNTIDNETSPGKVTMSAASLGTSPGPNGSGVLATFTFTPQSDGSSTLALQYVQLADVDGQVINTSLVPGRVTVGDVITQGYWSTQATGFADRLYLIDAVSENVAWAGGDGQTVYRTTDGGAAWENLWANIDISNVYAVAGIDANTAIVGGTKDDSGWQTRYYRTNDGGASWTQVFEREGWACNNMILFDPLNGMAIGDPNDGTWSILKTVDGGQNWTQLPNAPAQVGDEYSYMSAVSFVDMQTIWFGTQYNRLYKTADGGNTWAQIIVPGVSKTTQVAFNAAGIGLVSDGSSLARTMDNGASWETIDDPPGDTVRFLTFFQSQFWMASGSGIIYQSSDNGDTWTQETKGANLIRAISFIEKDGAVYGWATGNGGEMLRYKPNGDYVEFQVTVPENTPDGDGIFITGTFNAWDPGVFASDMNGNEHELHLANMGDRLFQITLEFSAGESIAYKYTRGDWDKVETDAHGGEIGNRALIVSSGKTIQTDMVGNWEDQPTGISEGIGSVLPIDYRLEQNFPNPFNPETTIRFAIPKQGRVKVAVYSMTGRQIETIIDEVRGAGVHDVVWNAHGLPTGIYLCLLEAGPHREMRKLILQK